MSQHVQDCVAWMGVHDLTLFCTSRILSYGNQYAYPKHTRIPTDKILYSLDIERAILFDTLVVQYELMLSPWLSLLDRPLHYRVLPYQRHARHIFIIIITHTIIYMLQLF